MLEVVGVEAMGDDVSAGPARNNELDDVWKPHGHVLLPQRSLKTPSSCFGLAVTLKCVYLAVGDGGVRYEAVS